MDKKSQWLNRDDAPVFPVIYLECKGAADVRGFEDLGSLIGDPDFSSYDFSGDLIIDSTGRVFELGFESVHQPVGILFPKSVVDLVDTVKIVEYVGNALLLHKQNGLLLSLKDKHDIRQAVAEIATFFSW